MFSPKVVNYLLCMTLIFLSGSPATSKNDYEMYISAFFIVVLVFALKNSIAIRKKAVIMVAIFASLVLAHIVIFGQGVAMASIGFMLQLSVAVMIAALMPQFVRYFVHCMSLIAFVSLFFYFLVVLPGQQDIFAPFDLAGEPKKINIGLYTFYTGGSSHNRNSGIFWEPGAFAGYLALALYCVAVLGRQLRVSVPAVLILVVALGTTLSTMGYVAFVAVCATYFVRKFSGKNPLLVFVGLPIAFLIMSVVVYQAAESIPFLKEKIVGQMHDVEDDRGRSEINRFGNALYDLDFVASRPIVGWSANVETRVLEDNLALDLLSGQGNALTGFAVRFGIVGWLAMILAFFTAFLSVSRSFPVAALGVGTIAIMLTGEKYLNFPLIMTFMFLNYRHVQGLSRLRRRRRRAPDSRPAQRRDRPLHPGLASGSRGGRPRRASGTAAARAGKAML